MTSNLYNESVTPYVEMKNSEIRRLYHYTSPEGLMGILNECSIRFTDAQYLNDKSELIEIYRVLNKVLYELKDDIEYLDDIKQLIELNKREDLYCNKMYSISEAKSKEKESRTRYYIFCTSTENDTASMWNYYVKNGNYEGYNIGYDKLELSDFLSKRITFPYEFIEGNVIYRDSEKEKILKEAIIKTNQNIKENMEKYNPLGVKEGYEEIVCDEVYSLDCEIEFLSFFFKSEVFIHENEYRYVLYISDNQQDGNFKKGYSVKKGVITPFYSVDYKKSTIKEIGISPLIEYDLAKIGISDFLNQHGWMIDNINIYQSKASLRY